MRASGVTWTIGEPILTSEEFTHSFGAYTDEDFFKLRARHVEERNARLPRDCTRQKSLASARRPREETAFGKLAAQSRERLGLPQVLYNVD